jgi:hypothetical protein
MSPTVDTTPPTAGLSESVTLRPEYPRPILVRDGWHSLNGPWLFRVDPDNRGLTETWFDGSWTDAQTITVPFSMESAASGIAEVNGTGFVSQETYPGPPVSTTASCAKPDRGDTPFRAMQGPLSRGSKGVIQVLLVCHCARRGVCLKIWG